MADTHVRLSGPALLPAAAATQYTATGVTAIVRNIHVFNNDVLAVTFTLSIGADAAGTRLYDALSIPSRSALDWSGSLVIADTEIIQALASSANKLTLTISGVETA